MSANALNSFLTFAFAGVSNAAYKSKLRVRNELLLRNVNWLRRELLLKQRKLRRCRIIIAADTKIEFSPSLCLTLFLLPYIMIEGETMRCRRQKIKSGVWFGAGLLTAALLPPKWTLVVAAVALVAVSISCFRR